MVSLFTRIRVIFLTCIVLLPYLAFSEKKEKKERKGEFYFSWGYNKEWYTNCNLYITQPSLGNDYVFENIKANDRPGWDNNFLKKDLSIPQYNYRLGYFFNKKKNLAVELNFDHTKFIISDWQEVHIKGRLNDHYVDETITFAGDLGFYYFLNNGANFLLLNIVKRWEIITPKSQTGNFKLDVLGKAGVGPVIPHVENYLFGHGNVPHFQLGGWNVGVEGALRATFYKYVYLEYCNKLDYARYSGLKVYEGTARHAFGTYEMILNLGVTFPVGKKMEDAN